MCQIAAPALRRRSPPAPPRSSPRCPVSRSPSAPARQVGGAQALLESAESTAASSFAASSSMPSPSRSSIAAERKVASGLAMPWPAMSGAEPWTGSNTPGPSSPRLAEGSIPSEPVSIAASSLRMSPNMFSVTITSKRAGIRDQLHRGVVDQQVVELDGGVALPHAARRPRATAARSRARSPCRPRSPWRSRPSRQPGAAPPRRRPWRSARSRSSSRGTRRWPSSRSAVFSPK